MSARLSPQEAIEVLQAMPCDVVQLGDGLASEFVPIGSCNLESPKDKAERAEEQAEAA
jgi:hypothetical protein